MTSVRDWLYGVGNTEPKPAKSADEQTEAERLQVIYHMITVANEEGDAVINPQDTTNGRMSTPCFLSTTRSPTIDG